LKVPDVRCYTGAVLESNIPPAGTQDAGQPDLAPDISVIIVTWNVRQLLEECLRALCSPEVREDLQLEVIVVDSASTDGTSEWLSNQPGIKPFRLEENVGFGRANNVGMQAARSEHLLLLNPDTVPQPGCLKPLLQFQRDHATAGIVSPRLLNKGGTLQRAAFRFPTLRMHMIDLFPLPKWVPGRIRTRIADSRLNGRYPEELTAREPFKIDHPLGACMLVSREAYSKAGGFDERIFMYSEEIDLTLRYQAAGYECWQVPSSSVIHLGGQSTGQAPARMKKALWRSRLYLYRKHYARWAQIGIRLLLLLSQSIDLVSLVARRVFGKVTRREWRRELRLARDLTRIALGR
jgi:N-acetylglucosaminyl-diphospho-decaprenol L-rhamnosyltransferase